MTQVGSEIDLATESLRAEGEAHFGEEHFDRDLPVVLEILGEIYRGHRPVTDLTLDLVAVRNGGFQAFE
jgi:hypothetical protein